eukprot:TRINITY_DN4837_c0_g1_i14.p1 TRINITY_DN4837_c0_g1~~TRINITY_DN4837_c0_g1_i14.p1  ORF type:complete len:399 (-),score=164.51 TRINITY_DN4837_c0_g1_i14:80-1276(-)
MALAEPRRRLKWSLNPRGETWANDTSKFGHKMLEKWGWEKGKGLGAKEDGRLEHIKVRHKQDSKGIGVEGYDDTWLEHQDDFQAVLAALNAEHGTGGSEDAEEKVETKSLEVTSKNSKKRVHYVKFTRGKDISNYSTDDLGCILGTKSDKVKKKKEESRTPSPEKEPETEVGIEEKSHGLVTIQGGNYQDYFKKKMAELRAKGKATYEPTVSMSHRSEEDSNSSEPTMCARDPFAQDAPEAPTAPQLEDNQSEVKEKKKKKKKRKHEEEEEEKVKEEEAASPTPAEAEPPKKKRKKEAVSVEEVTAPPSPMEEETSEKKKKKKKDKETAEPMQVEEAAATETETPKKKKKKKEKDADTTADPADTTADGADTTADASVLEGGEEKKKKKKKKKEKDDQ